MKLEKILVGGRRFTSQEALLRFFGASTTAESSELVGQQITQQQRRAIEEAEAYLKAEGI